ncbi:glycosyltransferase family 2 protein [Cloacibacillus sp.]
MIDRPLLSICIPTYNRSLCIKRQINDIILQTAAFTDDVEILVSDNASTDDTPRVIHTLCVRNKRIKHFRQPLNIGAEANFLFLAKEARGEYYWCLGDDDILRSGTVEYVVKILKKFRDIGAVILRCGGTYPILFSNLIYWKKANFNVDDGCIIRYIPEILQTYPNYEGDTDWMFISKCIIRRNAYIEIASNDEFRNNCALGLFATCISIRNKNFYYANACGYITGLQSIDNWHHKATKVCQDIISGISILKKYGFTCNEIEYLFASEEPHLYYVNTLGCMEKGMSVKESLDSNMELQRQLRIPVSKDRVLDRLRTKDPEQIVFLFKDVIKIAYKKASILSYVRKKRELKMYNYLPTRMRELKWIFKYMIIIGFTYRLKALLKNEKTI